MILSGCDRVYTSTSTTSKGRTHTTSSSRQCGTPPQTSVTTPTPASTATVTTEAQDCMATNSNFRKTVFRYILDFQNEEERLRKQSVATLKETAKTLGIEFAPRSTRSTLAKLIMKQKFGSFSKKE